MIFDFSGRSPVMIEAKGRLLGPDHRMATQQQKEEADRGANGHKVLFVDRHRTWADGSRFFPLQANVITHCRVGDCV